MITLLVPMILLIIPMLVSSPTPYHEIEVYRNKRLYNWNYVFIIFYGL